MSVSSTCSVSELTCTKLHAPEMRDELPVTMESKLCMPFRLYRRPRTPRPGTEHMQCPLFVTNAACHRRSHRWPLWGRTRPRHKSAVHQPTVAYSPISPEVAQANFGESELIVPANTIAHSCKGTWHWHKMRAPNYLHPLAIPMGRHRWHNPKLRCFTSAACPTGRAACPTGDPTWAAGHRCPFLWRSLFHCAVLTHDTAKPTTHSRHWTTAR